MSRHPLRPVFGASLVLLGAAAGSLLLPARAQAVTIARVSPEGEAREARQVVVGFDAPAVRFGDPDATAPVSLRCAGLPGEAPATLVAPPGQGRWTSEREWVHDFPKPLPSGVRCDITTHAGYRTPAGKALPAAHYRFDTGGPRLQRVRPWDGSHEIEEEQAFVLTLDVPATRASLQKHLWCSQPDLGERIPARLVEGELRTRILKGLGLEEAARGREGIAGVAGGPGVSGAPDTTVVVQCQRRLSAGTPLQVVLDAGIAAPSGVATRKARRLDYQVRTPFTAELQCERENAHAACLPIRPVTVRFSAPVSGQQASAVALQAGSQVLRPQVEGISGSARTAGADAAQDPAGRADPAARASATGAARAAKPDTLVESLQFNAPFAEHAEYTLILPEGLRDASGRALANAASFPLKVRIGQMPPLAKFGAAPFGIVERFAEGPDGPAMLPLTVRRIEAALPVQDLQPARMASERDRPSMLGGATLQLSQLQAREDASIIQWLRRIRYYDEGSVPRRVATQDARAPLPPPRAEDDDGYLVEARTVALLSGLPGVKTQPLPPPGAAPEEAGRAGMPAGAGGASVPAEAQAPAPATRGQIQVQGRVLAPQPEAGQEPEVGQEAGALQGTSGSPAPSSDAAPASSAAISAASSTPFAGPVSGAPSSTPVRPFEVLGIPLSPGFHVLEVGSSLLGNALLDPAYGAQRTLYVRTAALVTNLGVHFKQGREGAMAWVTTLDQGQPVENARVRVSGCDGEKLAEALTDAQGIALFPEIGPQPEGCRDETYGYGNDQGYFVSARHEEGGVEDLAFVWSNWQNGIEPWRFGVPTEQSATPDTRAHTVFDRTLLRAGETVSMKHFVRLETGPRQHQGLMLPEQDFDTLVITHEGSEQQFTLPLAWSRTASGGRTAISEFRIPTGARLGRYTTVLRRTNGEHDVTEVPSGHFRVEAFRLPVYQGSVKVEPDAAAATVGLQMDYVSGGPASQLPVQVSAVLASHEPAFAGYEAFSFQPPAGTGTHTAGAGHESEVSHEGHEGHEASDQDGDGDRDVDGDAPGAGAGTEDGTRRTLVANREALTLDAHGHGMLSLPLPRASRPQRLTVEASYADPSGEIQTLRGQALRWPATVQAGIRAGDWISVDRTLPVQLLALDTQGKPRADVPLRLQARARVTTSSRKRMVGGFYTYDSHTEVEDLGTLCEGRSDAQGRLDCTASLTRAGQVELLVTADDGQGGHSQAVRDVWVSRAGEDWWFGGENSDRIDIIPERREYRAGDTARFQVRMPFRQATALVAVEREGIITREVVELQGDDPTLSLKVDERWAPNVYVSVLAVRGRMREVPWYSFFSWGWHSPVRWWKARQQEAGEVRAPTALVDLAKPAFRFGMAEIRVDASEHRLDVKVQADRERYPVRGKAEVEVMVSRPDGSPASHAEVAVAVVDEALLELMPNTSWQLLEQMLGRRSWGVSTATAQMEIVGRRHYGRKALPPGGDGGGQATGTRELFETLLLWQPRVQTDALGRARVTVPLNDSLTRFRVVAVADHGVSAFGTGQTTLQVAQDLQLISGLPPMVRTGDAFVATFTLRNDTARAMQVTVTPHAQPLSQPLPAQQLAIPARASRQVAWNVMVPPQATGGHDGVRDGGRNSSHDGGRDSGRDGTHDGTQADRNTGAMVWEVTAQEQATGSAAARDVIRISQRVLPATPVTVQQATLVQVAGGNARGRGVSRDAAGLSLPVVPPAGALPGHSHLQLGFSPGLYDGLPSVRDWLRAYPYSCLEQQGSKAIGLQDTAHWQRLMQELPTYLDARGLADYFPPRNGYTARGSAVLTAFLLSASHEAALLDPAFALPEAQREQMLQGLRTHLEGREPGLEGSRHAGGNRDAARRRREATRLLAMEALSRYGTLPVKLFEGMEPDPLRLSTASLLDWVGILQRTPGLPARERHLQAAYRALRTRLSWQGTRLVLGDDADTSGWWRMDNGDVSAARLLLTVLEEPAWQPELGRLAQGLLTRQNRGAWQTTTANVWGMLAMARFGRQQEDVSVSGVTSAQLLPRGAVPARAGAQGSDTALKLDWSQRTDAAATLSGTLPLTGPATLQLRHQGYGRPWLTLQSLAAVPRTKPLFAGYRIQRTLTPVGGRDPSLPAGHYRRGDVVRVTLDIDASAPMAWVAVTDPIPAGATILGSGLGRDSTLALQGSGADGAADAERGGNEDAAHGAAEGWSELAFEERSFDALRSYYREMPQGRTRLEYTVRLNNPGRFNLPATRVEALYAPEMFGELPNAVLTVEAQEPVADAPATAPATVPVDR